jgi:hypothetical protein
MEIELSIRYPALRYCEHSANGASRFLACGRKPQEYIFSPWAEA